MHGSCNLIHTKNKSNNKMLNLNVDDDFDLLKQMCCILKRVQVSELVETRSLRVKIMKELAPDDEDELLICRIMKMSLECQMKKEKTLMITPMMKQ